jgi:hypothetical protein
MRSADLRTVAAGVIVMSLMNSPARAQENPASTVHKTRVVRVELTGDDDTGGQYCSATGEKCAALLRWGAGQTLRFHASDRVELAENETIQKAIIELEAAGPDNNPWCPKFVGTDNSLTVTLDSKSVGSTSLNGVVCWNNALVQGKTHPWPLWVVEFPEALRSAALGPLPNYHIQLGGTDRLVAFVPIRRGTLVLAIENRR